MADGLPIFAPLQSRILACRAQIGTSPWLAGFGPVRPIWPVHRWCVHAPKLWPLLDLIRRGLVPMDRAPIIDARDLTLSIEGRRQMLFYTWVRGIYQRALPYGVRLVTMVRWGTPNPYVTGWPTRWSARVVGPIWVWPALHPHSRWLVPVDAWLHAYERWAAPWLPYDAGLVLDTRMLALAGQVIPLPPAMVEALRPHVRLLVLADIPGPVHRGALGWPPSSRPWLTEQGAWLPGTTGRYSRARWEALLAQFPDVPIMVPAARHPADLPPWLEWRAQPSAQPVDSVCVPPPMSAVTLTKPTTLLRAPGTGKLFRVPLAHDPRQRGILDHEA